jgi:hypothetical protein
MENTAIRLDLRQVVGPCFVFPVLHLLDGKTAEVNRMILLQGKIDRLLER